MLDERSRRRPTFLGGIPVRLMDGQEWFIPQPTVRLDTIAGTAGPVLIPRFEMGDDPDFHEGFEELNRRFNEAKDQDGRNEVTFLAAHAFLVINYDLTHEEVGCLLNFDPDTDPNAVLVMFTNLIHATTIRPIEEWRKVAATIPYRTPEEYLRQTGQDN